MAKGSSGGGAHFCHFSQNSWRISSCSEQILSGEDPILAGLSSSPLQVLWVTVFPEPQEGSVGGEDESFPGISRAKELSLPQAMSCSPAFPKTLSKKAVPLFPLPDCIQAPTFLSHRLELTSEILMPICGTFHLGQDREDWQSEGKAIDSLFPLRPA